MKRKFWAARRELKALALWAVTSVPLRTGELLRQWLLPRFMGAFGAQSVVQSGLRLTNPERIRVGGHCNFAQNVFITGGGGVTIGDWVGFGPDVKIWSVNHRFDDPDRPWQLQGWNKEPVVIEDDVWLGANVFVMPGVRIGRGAIVSAGSVVNKSLPAFAVAAGNPARVVGWRRHPDAQSAAAPLPGRQGATLTEPSPAMASSGGLCRLDTDPQAPAA